MARQDNGSKKGFDDRDMVIEPKYNPEDVDENGYYKGTKKKENEEDKKKEKK